MDPNVLSILQSLLQGDTYTPQQTADLAKMARTPNVGMGPQSPTKPPKGKLNLTPLAPAPEAAAAPEAAPKVPAAHSASPGLKIGAQSTQTASGKLGGATTAPTVSPSQSHMNFNKPAPSLPAATPATPALGPAKPNATGPASGSAPADRLLGSTPRMINPEKQKNNSPLANAPEADGPNAHFERGTSAIIPGLAQTNIPRTQKEARIRESDYANLHTPTAIAMVKRYNDRHDGTTVKKVGIADRNHIRSVLDPVFAMARHGEGGFHEQMANAKRLLQQSSLSGSVPTKVREGNRFEPVSIMSLAHAHQILEHYEQHGTFPHWWHDYPTPLNRSRGAPVEPKPDDEDGTFGAPSTPGMKRQAEEREARGEPRPGPGGPTGTHNNYPAFPPASSTSVLPHSGAAATPAVVPPTANPASPTTATPTTNPVPAADGTETAASIKPQRAGTGSPGAGAPAAHDPAWLASLPRLAREEKVSSAAEPVADPATAERQELGQRPPVDPRTAQAQQLGAPPAQPVAATPIPPTTVPVTPAAAPAQPAPGTLPADTRLAQAAQLATAPQPVAPQPVAPQPVAPQPVAPQSPALEGDVLDPAGNVLQSGSSTALTPPATPPVAAPRTAQGPIVGSGPTINQPAGPPPAQLAPVPQPAQLTTGTPEPAATASPAGPEASTAPVTPTDPTPDVSGGADLGVLPLPNADENQPAAASGQPAAASGQPAAASGSALHTPEHYHQTMQALRAAHATGGGAPQHVHPIIHDKLGLDVPTEDSVVQELKQNGVVAGDHPVEKTVPEHPELQASPTVPSNQPANLSPHEAEPTDHAEGPAPVATGKTLGEQHKNLVDQHQLATQNPDPTAGQAAAKKLQEFRDKTGYKAEEDPDGTKGKEPWQDAAPEGEAQPNAYGVTPPKNPFIPHENASQAGMQAMLQSYTAQGQHPRSALGNPENKPLVDEAINEIKRRLALPPGGPGAPVKHTDPVEGSPLAAAPEKKEQAPPPGSPLATAAAAPAKEEPVAPAKEEPAAAPEAVPAAGGAVREPPSTPRKPNLLEMSERVQRIRSAIRAGHAPSEEDVARYKEEKQQFIAAAPPSTPPHPMDRFAAMPDLKAGESPNELPELNSAPEGASKEDVVRHMNAHHRAATRIRQYLEDHGNAMRPDADKWRTQQKQHEDLYRQHRERLGLKPRQMRGPEAEADDEVTPGAPILPSAPNTLTDTEHHERDFSPEPGQRRVGLTREETDRRHQQDQEERNIREGEDARTYNMRPGSDKLPPADSPAPALSGTPTDPHTLNPELLHHYGMARVADLSRRHGKEADAAQSQVDDLMEDYKAKEDEDGNSVPAKAVPANVFERVAALQKRIAAHRSAERALARSLRVRDERMLHLSGLPHWQNPPQGDQEAWRKARAASARENFGVDSPFSPTKLAKWAERRSATAQDEGGEFAHAGRPAIPSLLNSKSGLPAGMSDEHMLHHLNRMRKNKRLSDELMGDMGEAYVRHLNRHNGQQDFTPFFGENEAQLSRTKRKALTGEAGEKVDEALQRMADNATADQYIKSRSEDIGARVPNNTGSVGNGRPLINDRHDQEALKPENLGRNPQNTTKVKNALNALYGDERVTSSNARDLRRHVLHFMGEIQSHLDKAIAGSSAAADWFKGDKVKDLEAVQQFAEHIFPGHPRRVFLDEAISRAKHNEAIAGKTAEEAAALEETRRTAFKERIAAAKERSAAAPETAAPAEEQPAPAPETPAPAPAKTLREDHFDALPRIENPEKDFRAEAEARPPKPTPAPELGAYSPRPEDEPHLQAMGAQNDRMQELGEAGRAIPSYGRANREESARTRSTRGGVSRDYESSRQKLAEQQYARLDDEAKQALAPHVDDNGKLDTLTAGHANAEHVNTILDAYKGMTPDRRPSFLRYLAHQASQTDNLNARVPFDPLSYATAASAIRNHENGASAQTSAEKPEVTTSSESADQGLPEATADEHPIAVSKIYNRQQKNRAAGTYDVNSTTTVHDMEPNTRDAAGNSADPDRRLHMTVSADAQHPKGAAPSKREPIWKVHYGDEGARTALNTPSKGATKTGMTYNEAIEHAKGLIRQERQRASERRAAAPEPSATAEEQPEVAPEQPTTAPEEPTPGYIDPKGDPEKLQGQSRMDGMPAGEVQPQQTSMGPLPESKPAPKVKETPVPKELPGQQSLLDAAPEEEEEDTEEEASPTESTASGPDAHRKNVFARANPALSPEQLPRNAHLAGSFQHVPDTDASRSYLTDRTKYDNLSPDTDPAARQQHHASLLEQTQAQHKKSLDSSDREFWRHEGQHLLANPPASSAPATQEPAAPAAEGTQPRAAQGRYRPNTPLARDYNLVRNSLEGTNAAEDPEQYKLFHDRALGMAKFQLGRASSRKGKEVWENELKELLKTAPKAAAPVTPPTETAATLRPTRTAAPAPKPAARKPVEPADVLPEHHEAYNKLDDLYISTNDAATSRRTAARMHTIASDMLARSRTKTMKKYWGQEVARMAPPNNSK